MLQGNTTKKTSELAEFAAKLTKPFLESEQSHLFIRDYFTFFIMPRNPCVTTAKRRETLAGFAWFCQGFAPSFKMNEPITKLGVFKLEAGFRQFRGSGRRTPTNI
jgi:hypothetical protein